MPYQLFNGTRPENLFTYANDIVDGSLGWGILLIVFLVSFTYLMDGGNKRAFAGAMFLTSVIAGLLWFIEMIQPMILFIVGIGFILSVVFLRSGNE